MFHSLNTTQYKLFGGYTSGMLLTLCLILTESSLDDIDDGLAGINIGANLTFSGRVFGSFLKNHDLGALES